MVKNQALLGFVVIPCSPPFFNLPASSKHHFLQSTPPPLRRKQKNKSMSTGSNSGVEPDFSAFAKLKQSENLQPVGSHGEHQAFSIVSGFPHSVSVANTPKTSSNTPTSSSSRTQPHKDEYKTVSVSLAQHERYVKMCHESAKKCQHLPLHLSSGCNRSSPFSCNFASTSRKPAFPHLCLPGDRHPRVAPTHQY